MTYLVITDNLVDNLDDLDINELKYEKIKFHEINNDKNVSLFSDDSYKFVTDEFLTYKNLEQINYDFDSKYINKGTEYIKADLSVDKLNEIKDYAWHAFSSLGCSKWGRVDFIEDNEGNFQIIEVNTVPGLTETSLFPKAASYEGIDFDELIIKVLHLSCK